MRQSLSFVFIILLIFNTASTAQNKINIMPLGNSITSGRVQSDDRAGYRRLLHVLLTGHGYNVKFVGDASSGTKTDFDTFHNGNGGWFAFDPNDTVKSISEHVYGYLSKETDYILLHIGSNDIDAGDSAETVIKDLTRILDEIDEWENNRSKSITVVLAKIINRNDKLLNSDESLELSIYNQMMDSLVNSRKQRANPDKIILIDMENGSDFNYEIDNEAPYFGDLSDNLHPNNSGYEKIALKWYSELSKILPKEINPVIKLLNPELNSIYKDSVTLSWTEDPDAEKYRIQIYTDSLFLNKFLDQENVYGTSLNVYELPTQSKLYWRVISIDSTSSTNIKNLNYSVINTFRTDPYVLNPVQLASPANNAVKLDTSLIFSWQPTENAEKYELQISEKENFSTILKKYSTLNSTSVKVDGLSYGTQLFWKVIAEDSNNKKAESSIRKFSTKLLPPVNFKAIAKERKKVELSWNDTYNNETKFIIERKIKNGSFNKLVELDANITEYIDENNLIDSTTYYYRIKTVNSITQSDFSNEVEILTLSDVLSAEKLIPDEYNLSQNYPNPFNPSTKINFALPEAGIVKLIIYNAIGKEVSILVNDYLEAGNYQYEFNAINLSSGIYFYKIMSNNFTQIKKMILVK